MTRRCVRAGSADAASAIGIHDVAEFVLRCRRVTSATEDLSQFTVVPGEGRQAGMWGGLGAFGRGVSLGVNNEEGWGRGVRQVRVNVSSGTTPL